MNTTYQLVHKRNQTEVTKSGTLAEIWEHSRLTLNNPIDWLVQEMVDGKMNDMVTAKFLIERYKSADRLPRRFSMIPAQVLDEE